jgi:hypothetical protein
MVRSTEASKVGVGRDTRNDCGLRAVRVDLHHRQGEGDGHGGVEALRESNHDDQDAGEREAAEDVAGHLQVPGVGRWRRDQLPSIDPVFLDQAVRCVADLHHGSAAILHDHGGPVAGFGAERKVQTGAIDAVCPSAHGDASSSAWAFWPFRGAEPLPRDSSWSDHVHPGMQIRV